MHQTRHCNATAHFAAVIASLAGIRRRSILPRETKEHPMSELYDKAWPTELRVSEDRRTLTVAFDDGSRFALPAEMLRVLSPSAEVQGHGPGQKVTVPGKRMVGIRNAIAAGNYAVRIAFDDGHDSGIFTWRYLRELGEKGQELFAAYEAELAEKGLNRDNPAMSR
jgi:DUF971 family protein